MEIAELYQHLCQEAPTLAHDVGRSLGVGIQQLTILTKQIAVDGAEGVHSCASELLTAQHLFHHTQVAALHLAIQLHINCLHSKLPI